jgi:hypothetical protein
MKKTRQVKGDLGRRKRRRRRLLTPLFLTLCMLLFVISAGISYIYFKPIFAFKTPSTVRSLHEGTDRSEKAESYQSRLYNTEPLYRAGVKRTATVVIIEDVIREYLRPYGVRLLDLYIDRQGIVYIDLGDEIIKNFSGDLRQEYDLVVGLYLRIKNSVKNIRAIRLLIEGKEADSIGGHIDISRPIGGNV